MILPIEGAREGMVLKEPAKDAHGRALLPAGATLTPETLSKLRHRGVKTIEVEAPEESAAAPDSPEAAAFAHALGGRLDILFGGFPDDTLMQDLRELAEAHLLQNPDLWDLVNLPRP